MSTTNDVLTKALRKATAAAGGMGFKAVAIGAIAHHAWGVNREIPGVELLISSGPDKRESFLGAARGEGLQQSPEGPLRLKYTDAKLGGTATVDITEASTPFHAQIISRAQQGNVLTVGMLLATCEDLIVLGADRQILVDLLRHNAGRIDGAYLKKEAEAAGVFNEVKQAWQQARA